MKKRLLSLALMLTLMLALSPSVLAEEDTTLYSYNSGDDNTYVAVMSFLYINEKGGLTRVECPYTDLIVEEYDSAYQLVSHRYLSGAANGFAGFYAGQDYNFLIRPSLKDDGTAAICVDKYSKDWQLLQTGTLQDANTLSVSAAFDCAEKNGMLFIHGDHKMLKSSDGVSHQANVSLTVRISDMTVVDSFHGLGGSTFVSHSLNGWHVLADQEDNLVMFEVGDGHPRAPVFQRLNGYAASASHSAKLDRVLLFDIPGEIGDNATGVVASGLEETRNYYVLAYRANRGLPSSIISSGPYDNYLAFISKSDLSVKTVRLETPASGPDNAFPKLVSNGLDGGYIIWRNYSFENDPIGEGEICFAAYSDGAVGPVQNLGRSVMSDCRPILYNGRLVWYCTKYSEPVFYGADTTGVRILNASTTAPGTLGGSAAPVTPATPSAGNFTDVAADSPFKDAIAWAVDQGITNGTSATTFGPGNTCTVSHILTFLYRAAGRPGMGSDERAGMTAWAQGLGLDTSNLSAPCTRSAAVTCMWKAAGSPAPSGSASFSDVAADAPYAQAVAWAVEKGVTNGTGADTFSPDRTCTRGQIVTFLYRNR